MKTRFTIREISRTALAFLSAFCLTCCDDFVKIDPPRTDLIKMTVFESDATANAAMVDIYYQLSRTGFVSGNSSSISFIGSLSSDELINYADSRANRELNSNDVSVSNDAILTAWTDMYKAIYKANAIIEGLASQSGVSQSVSDELTGEAKFVRAFTYFYLVNLWGDVPLATTTDYRANSTLSRTSKAEVYKQIVADLLDAQKALPADFAVGNNERVRPNKWSATALLARVYLFLQDWTNAEIQATSVIDTTPLFSLATDLTKVFTKNSSEAIWQFHTVNYPNEISTFYIFSTPPNTGALRDGFQNAFEPGDNRRATWVGSIISGTNTYYFSAKYQSLVKGAEYSTLLRLAEQYLIRAEARAQLGNVAGAQTDINLIRTRAGLTNTPATDKNSLLLAIEQERKVELFVEQAHRWLDLIRTGRADVILAPIKGSSWVSTDSLYPIPQSQITNDPGMMGSQNPGY